MVSFCLPTLLRKAPCHASICDGHRACHGSPVATRVGRSSRATRVVAAMLPQQQAQEQSPTEPADSPRGLPPTLAHTVARALPADAAQAQHPGHQTSARSPGQCWICVVHGMGQWKQSAHERQANHEAAIKEWEAKNSKMKQQELQSKYRWLLTLCPSGP